MTFYVENETGHNFRFNIEELATKVGDEVLKKEGCKLSPAVNLLVTDPEGIRDYNRDFRNIDKETDVLSFPNLEFERPGYFDPKYLKENEADLKDPDTGEIILGDIIINRERVLSQSKKYNHSVKREFAFLVAHSMLHLCGYDHMTKEEAEVMEKKQEEALTSLGITRE
ncbi:MAG: rRNA maturation RNase YbeY [Lachnospiraceae bacterium]|nr:rRNA maturation RNase YbeY [Lachnospiraceae bacterium]MBR4993558.1 rRNA maturation RNase YbeY [Lachnospiraceae bacterium]